MSLEAFLVWGSDTSSTYELIGGKPTPISNPIADCEDLTNELCDLLKRHCTEHQLSLIPRQRTQLVFVGERNGK